MLYLIIAFHFLFGAIIGSFLNVLILRHNTGRNISGRSSCPNCKHNLKWPELIPIFSWVFQGGRCTSCGARISKQYPAVEFLSGVLFLVVAFLGLSAVPHILALVILSLLTVIFVYDLKHTIIPNIWVYAFVILSLVFFVVNFEGGISATDIFWRILFGVAIASPFAFLWFISHGRWMGLGDAKLMLGIGILLGLEQGFFAIMSAFVVGAAFGLVLIMLSSDVFRQFTIKFTPTLVSKMMARGFTMKSEIPFGPFLIGVSVIVWFLNLQGIYLSLEMLTRVLL